MRILHVITSLERRGVVIYVLGRSVYSPLHVFRLLGLVRKCQERARMFDISVMVKKYMDVYKYGHVLNDGEDGEVARV